MVEREALGSQFEHLLSGLREQKKRLAAGDSPLFSLAGEYCRQAEGIRNWVESSIGRASNEKEIVALKKAIYTIITLNKDLQDVAKQRQTETAAALAAIRRGRNGIRKYGPKARRRSCRFVHQAA